jgi:hypothetical protein
MSFTHGGPNKRKQFEWHYDPVTCQLIIIIEKRRELMYSLGKIQKVLIMLFQSFSSDYFPLSSNAALPGEARAKTSLGEIIFEQFPGEFDRAQGASYLGVVLEECGYLEWNGRHVGIEWRLVEGDFSKDKLAVQLTSRQDLSM